VATPEERIAYLEGRAEEQALLRRLDALDQKLDQRTFAIVRTLHERADALDGKITRRFGWLAAALLVAVLATAYAIAAAVLG